MSAKKMNLSVERLITIKLASFTLLFWLNAAASFSEDVYFGYAEEAVIYYSLEYGTYPPANSIVELANIFEGKRREMILKFSHDHWGNELSYTTSKDYKRYVIASPGKNARYEKSIASYLYDIPNIEIFGDDDKADDVIFANECTRRLPVGYAGSCSNTEKTEIIIRNLGEALRVLQLKNQSYPTNLIVQSLQKFVRQVTGLPYQLTSVDGWGKPLTYICFNGNSEYLLASAGRDGRFDRKLEEYLKAKKPRSFVPTQFKEDLVIVNGIPVTWYELSLF